MTEHISFKSRGDIPSEDRLPDASVAAWLPGLYIHIPFCIRKCGYCDFYSVTDTKLIPAFLDALSIEMSLYHRDVDSFDTVYIGGGSPSVLTPADFARLFIDIRGNFVIRSEAEITVEVNPADVTCDLLEALRRAGVNRINIGVQSLDDRFLAFLGRRHDRSQAVLAVEKAVAAGFLHIGIDMIYGIPGQTISSWLDTLQDAIALSPEHLSCYQLTFEPKTPLAERCRNGEVIPPDESLQIDYFLRTSELLEDAHYIHYEISNFALAGSESRHNSKYWNHSPYLGIGPAAHSFFHDERRWNHRSLDAYLQDLSVGLPPIEAKERLSEEQLRLEAWYLGLRTRAGIHLETFKRRYGQDLIVQKGELLKQLVGDGLLEIRDECLRPTRAGMLVADSLATV
jgi:oxygen-independent coproporphyrinogen-3 oxidase